MANVCHSIPTLLSQRKRSCCVYRRQQAESSVIFITLSSFFRVHADTTRHKQDSYFVLTNSTKLRVLNSNIAPFMHKLHTTCIASTEKKGKKDTWHGTENKSVYRSVYAWKDWIQQTKKKAKLNVYRSLAVNEINAALLSFHSLADETVQCQYPQKL